MNAHRISTGMRVISRDNVSLGIVEAVEEHGFTLKHDSGGRHRVGMADVARVDDHVHLSRDGAFFTRGAAAAATADEPGGLARWLIPLLIGLGLLALLIWGLGSCSKRDREAEIVDPAATEQSAPATGAAGALAGDGEMLPALQAYLASGEAAPRTFTFDRLNFDTNSSAIRPQDQQTLQLLAQALREHPKARVRIIGYADARGDASTNAQLGEQRARAVVAALTGSGVPAAQVEAGTGGEQNPRDTNASAQGQFENRRTELVVLQK